MTLGRSCCLVLGPAHAGAPHLIGYLEHSHIAMLWFSFLHVEGPQTVRPAGLNMRFFVKLAAINEGSGKKGFNFQ